MGFHAKLFAGLVAILVLTTSTPVRAYFNFEKQQETYEFFLGEYLEDRYGKNPESLPSLAQWPLAVHALKDELKTARIDEFVRRDIRDRQSELSKKEYLRLISNKLNFRKSFVITLPDLSPYAFEEGGYYARDFIPNSRESVTYYFNANGWGRATTYLGGFNLQSTMSEQLTNEFQYGSISIRKSDQFIPTEFNARFNLSKNKMIWKVNREEAQNAREMYQQRCVRRTSCYAVISFDIIDFETPDKDVINGFKGPIINLKARTISIFSNESKGNEEHPVLVFDNTAP